MRSQWALFLLYCRTNVRLFLRLCCKKSWIAIIFHLLPPMKKNLAILLLACVASVERGRGRGRGNLGVREALSPSRVPKFPLPLPLSTPDTQTTLLQDSLRTWVVLEKSNIAIQLVMRQCCKTNCVLVRVASWVKRQVSRYVLRHCFTDCLMLGTKATNIK